MLALREVAGLPDRVTLLCRGGGGVWCGVSGSGKRAKGPYTPGRRRAGRRGRRSTRRRGAWASFLVLVLRGGGGRRRGEPSRVWRGSDAAGSAPCGSRRVRRGRAGLRSSV